MRQRFALEVPGGNIHLVPWTRLQPLQTWASEVGAARFPLLLRIGPLRVLTLQPITARVLLAEVEDLAPRLAGVEVPGVRFLGLNGQELGGVYSPSADGEILATPAVQLGATIAGIRLSVGGFPPPVGFRSLTGIPKGRYACYFQGLSHGPDGWVGTRAEAMGGSGAPVRLEEVPIPPAARWDYTCVIGNPAVTAVEPLVAQATDVYRDAIHAFVSACNESLRLHQPLTIRPE